MVTFTARLRIKPGQEDAAEARARAMVQAVHENEPDTLIYIAHRSEDNPQDMLFYEVYRNEAAKHAHGNTPYLAELAKDIGTVFDSEFGIKIENLGRVAACVRD